MVLSSDIFVVFIVAFPLVCFTGLRTRIRRPEHRRESDDKILQNALMLRVRAIRFQRGPICKTHDQPMRVALARSEKFAPHDKSAMPGICFGRAYCLRYVTGVMVSDLSVISAIRFVRNSAHINSS